MRSFRAVLMVLALVAATVIPAVAQAQVEVSPWRDGGVAERVAGWLEGLWRALAGSETGSTDEVPPADPLAVAPEGPPTSCEDHPGTQGEVYPEFDPDG